MSNYENGLDNDRPVHHPALVGRSTPNTRVDGGTRGLARGPEFEAIAMQDANGKLRYMYLDGGIDAGSTLDIRNPFIEVAGSIALEAVTVLNEDYIDPSNPDLTPAHSI